MKILKPLFFSKYKPTTTYSYPEWDDISFFIENKKISALIRETTHTAKGIVILCHPQLSEAKQFFVRMEHDKLYRQLGFHTVIFDFNGLGESEDRGFGFGVDIHETVKRIKSLYPDLPIVLHGVSFGGSQLITGAIMDINLVDKIVIENAICSTSEYYKHRQYTFLYLVMQLYYFFFPKEREQSLYYNTISNISDTPLLFIYGSNDKKTPVWMGEKLYNGANQPKQMEIFESEHLTTIKEDTDRYTSLLADFLND